MSESKKYSNEEMQQLMETNTWWKEITDEIDRVYMIYQLKDVVSAEQKSEAVEAMFEHSLISEKDLIKAQSDSVFEEAKSIIEKLKTGDKFPDRLIELYNSKIPVALNVINQTVLALNPLLSSQTVQSEIENLWNSNRSSLKNIDLSRLPQNLYVKNADDRYILRSVIRLSELDGFFQNNKPYPFASDTYTPASVRNSDTKTIEVGFGALNEETESLLNQRVNYLAYRVYNPLWYCQMERYEPEYVTFRLKWINESQLIEYLYEHHKAGKDVISIFISLYNNEERLDRLKTAISFCPITQNYGTLFSEAVDSYKDGRYGVCATALLPMIEGIIWEFAWWWNETKGGLFDREITHIEYKDSTSFELLKPDGSKTGGRPNIGKLLQQTKFGEEVYFEVVEYLTTELFEERNPTLHGRDPHYGSKKKAASLLFVIETLERQITGALKQDIGEHFIDLIKSGKLNESEISNT
jgi:hypothetical protein